MVVVLGFTSVAAFALGLAFNLNVNTILSDILRIRKTHNVPVSETWSISNQT